MFSFVINLQSKRFLKITLSIRTGAENFGQRDVFVMDRIKIRKKSCRDSISFENYTSQLLSYLAIAKPLIGVVIPVVPNGESCGVDLAIPNKSCVAHVQRPKYQFVGEFL